MSDSFRFVGSYSSAPLFGVQSAFPTISAPIDESMQLAKRFTDTLLLETEGPIAVSLAGLTDVNLIVVKAVGGPIELSITTTLGVALIPVESFFMLFSFTTGITAITVERSPGVETYVEVFMGQSA